MAHPIPGTDRRKLVFDCCVIADRTPSALSHDNPQLEAAQKAMLEAVKALRAAADWQDAHDPEVKAGTPEQLQNSKQWLESLLDENTNEEKSNG